MYKIIILIYLVLFSVPVSAQVYTKNPELIKDGNFIVGGGVLEFVTGKNYRMNMLPFMIQTGLSKKVEFVGLFPWLIYRREGESRSQNYFGDIILDLKFNLNKYWYNFFNREVSAALDLYVGINGATGPTVKEASEFYGVSTGLVDVRLGLLYSQRILRRLSNYLNFIYVYASESGEDYLPFSSSIWSKKDGSYLFNIHKVIGKFIWPGKIDDEYWGRNDYIIYNVSLNYDLYIRDLLYRYKFFMELNGLRNFTPACIFGNELLYTVGAEVRIFKNWRVIGAATLPIILDSDYYFKRKYILMVYALL